MATLPEDNIEDNIEQQQLEFESLQSIFNEEMIVITPVKEYMINVSIHCNESVELQLKTDIDIPPTDLERAKAPPTLLPRATSTKPVQVHHLPPVTLYIRYHDNYPSNMYPDFHLTARWLNKNHMTILSDKLRAQFTHGWPVVYNWVSYIETDFILEYCQLESSEGATPLPSPPSFSNQLFVRSISEFNDVEEYNCYETHKEFVAGKHQCMVCFDTKFGDQFIEPCTECGLGLFCKECVTEHCQTVLADGRVTSMTCLSTDCTKLLSDALVKTLLTEKQFEKYTHLREEVVLDSIPGMVFCPRSTCGSRIVSDPKSDLVVCSQCSFPFCRLCRQTWHGIEKCSVFDKVTEAVTSEETTVKSRSKEEELRKVEELKSMIWMRSHRSVSQCPNCATHIQKIGGCNKMTCWKCGKGFCWICGQLIAGYGHFDERLSRCELFRTEDYHPPEEERDGDNATANVPVHNELSLLENILESGCPRCGLVRQKISNNNWVKCERCRLPFCLRCREPAYGRYHFSQYGCKEFSTMQEDIESSKEE